jgi:2-methylcitrate dehydratase PrpD
MVSTRRNITQELVAFVTAIQFEDLPKEVVHEAKRVLLDSVGCALGGIHTDKGKISIKLAREFNGKPESTIIGTDEKISCINAAFANGELINALDMDAILYPGHVAPYVIPGPLAVAERIGSSGKDLLLAVALGHEISSRFGEALRGPKKFIKEDSGGRIVISDINGLGFCIFGGTAGLGKILKLDHGKMVHAIGIAGHICPVPGVAKWHNTDPPSGMTKYLSAGWLGEAEITAAFLAEKGYIGDIDVLSGEYGFWKCFASDKWRPDLLMKKLGQEWRFLNTAYKPYPCCRLMHSGLDSFIKVIEENRLMPEDIHEVNLLLDPLTDKPLWHNREIKTHVDAQFSVPYVFAVAAHRIRSGADWQSLSTITNPKIREFMNKVRFKPHPRFDEIMLKGRMNSLSKVEVVAKGKTFSEEKGWMKGDAFPEEARMTDEELSDKFRNNAQSILTPDRIEKIVRIIFGLDTIQDVRELTHSLVSSEKDH